MSGLARLDRAGATRRAQRARDGLLAISDTIETLIEIQERQDWLTLGYKNWTEYCEAEFGPARLKLSAEQRGAAVAVLVASGMPRRRVAVALGVSEGTVRNDLKGARVPQAKGAQNYAPPVADVQVNPAAVNPETHFSGLQDAIDNKAAAGVQTSPADEAHDAVVPDDSGASAADPAPVGSGDGAAVTPTDHPDAPGDEDGMPVPSDAQPQADDVSNDAGSDETETEVASPRSDPVEVDERQPEGAGVSPPAAGSDDDEDEELAEEDAAPVDPIDALEALADVFDAIDSDVLGPMLTADEVGRLGVALGRIAEVVDLLDRWHERTNP